VRMYVCLCVFVCTCLYVCVCESVFLCVVCACVCMSVICNMDWKFICKYVNIITVLYRLFSLRRVKNIG